MLFLEAEEKVVASPEDTEKNETGSNCGLDQKIMEKTRKRETIQMRSWRAAGAVWA